MNALDIVLILYLAVHTLSGFKRGFVHVIGSLIGMGAGAYVAFNYSAQVAAWLAKISGFDIQQLGKWVTFLVVFIIISQGVGFAFWLFEHTTGILFNLPFISSMNHLLGGLLAFFEGAFFLGLALYYAKYLPVPQLMTVITASKLAPWFLKISQIFLPLIPVGIKNAMQGLI